MKKIICSRIFGNENKTLSQNHLVAENGKHLIDYKGIELPWKENARRISCFPAGIYRAVAVQRYSNKKYALWIQDVPDRSQIMVHSANFVRDLLGCLAPGTQFADIDRDGIIDVKNSAYVMRQLQMHIPLGTEIEYHVIDTWRVYGNKNIEIETL